VSAVFITATGTDIGKTHIACALIRALRAKGRAVEAFKPVLSGYDAFAGSDAARLLDALGKSEADLDRMSPLRFTAPLAPPSAARAEGATLDLADLAVRCRERAAAANGLLLIEGAGGVMSPIAESATNLDLLCELQAPAIVVSGSYLGAISHVLTALETLWARGVPIAAVAVSESEDAPPLTEITDALATFAPYIPVVVAPRGPDWDAGPLAALL
jgi:dethiobiotin synthetase